MKSSLISIFLLIGILRTQNIEAKIVDENNDDSNCGERKTVTYVAAVLEYEPYNRWADGADGPEVLRRNALAFADFAKQAKQQGADILITPEYGVQSVYMDKFDTEKMIKYSQYVPHPRDRVRPFSYNASTSSNNIEAMVILSNAAFENKIYIVVDLSEVLPCNFETIQSGSFYMSQTRKNCPPSGYVFFNTQVVFDRDGYVVGRYRKINLYQEDHFTPGTLDDSAVFVTDFDVAFSLQICFDLMYEHPGPSNIEKYGIRDIAMSTAWVDYTPYFFAHQAHNGFAQGLGINLLVSGHHIPEKGYMGSGLYLWQKDNTSSYVYNKDSGNHLLVGNVTTVSYKSLDNELSPYFEAWKIYWHELNYRNLKASFNILAGLTWDERFDKEVIFKDAADILSGQPRTQWAGLSDISNFTAVRLPGTSQGESKTVEACHGGLFCCELTYAYSGKYDYKLLVDGDGVMGGRYLLGSKICSVVMCPNDDLNDCGALNKIESPLESFGPFQLSAKYEGNRTLVFPQGVTRDLKLVDENKLIFEQDVETNVYTLKSDISIDNILVLALYGRYYPNDREEPAVSYISTAI